LTFKLASKLGRRKWIWLALTLVTLGAGGMPLAILKVREDRLLIENVKRIVSALHVQGIKKCVIYSCQSPPMYDGTFYRVEGMYGRLPGERGEVVRTIRGPFCRRCKDVQFLKAMGVTALFWLDAHSIFDLCNAVCAILEPCQFPFSKADQGNSVRSKAGQPHLKSLA
jgi:hypothetical protein